MKTLSNDFYKNRFRNQFSNLVTSGSILALLAGGIFAGAVMGVAIAKQWGLLFTDSGSIQALIVILMTFAGFATALFFSYALSPLLVRVSLRGKPCLNPKAVAAFQSIVQLQNRLQIDLYEVNDAENPAFGANVVVAGFTLGRGWLRPAIFASRTVISQCTEVELHAIFSHEISHLSAWHLFSRVKTALLTFFTATFFMSFILLGLQWSGYTQIVTVTSTFAGLIPALLTWMQTRNQIHDQEKEADQMAISQFQASAWALLSALEKLTGLSGQPPAKIVQERINDLKKNYPELSFAKAA